MTVTELLVKTCREARDMLAQNVYECGKPGTWATYLDDRLAEAIAAATAERVTRWVCPHCGSDRVQCQMLVDVNTHEVYDDAGRNAWCEACEEAGRDGELKHLKKVHSHD